MVTEKDNTDGLLYYRFSPEVAEIVRKSEIYAILNLTMMEAFESKYSVKLYEFGARRINLQAPFLEVTIKQLREIFNVPDNAYKDFSVLRNRVIETAQKEVNRLSNFSVTFTPIKEGRKFTKVKFGFFKKDDYGTEKAQELLEMDLSDRRAVIKESEDHTEILNHELFQLDSEGPRRIKLSGGINRPIR